jgi:hypothetical protein
MTSADAFPLLRWTHEVVDGLVEALSSPEVRLPAQHERCVSFAGQAEVGAEVPGTLPAGGEDHRAEGADPSADFRGLRKLARASGERFRGGVVRYDGEASLGFGDGLFAVPLRALVDGPGN